MKLALPLRLRATRKLAIPSVALVGALDARDVCAQGKVGTPPVFIMCPHNTVGGVAGDPEGPSHSSNYSSKAIIEREGLSYGGVRPYDDPAQPSNEYRCCVDNTVRVTCVQTLTSTATPGSDFNFKQHCCTTGSPRTPVLGDVESLGGDPAQWRFKIPKNDTLGNNPVCACPPQDFRQSCDGNVVLQMTSSHIGPHWEPPEEFGLVFDAVEAVAEPGDTLGEHVNFEIGNTSVGLVWVLQDSCESRTLFEYDFPVDSEGPGIPCIQLASEFRAVTGQATQLNCNQNYYYTDPVSGAGPFTIAGAVMQNYVYQNGPGAAAEVVVEGSHFDLLLGYIDRNAVFGTNSVGGEFYEGLDPSGDRVQIQLIIKNHSNWAGNMPPECANSTPPPPGAAEYDYYAVPGASADFEIAVREANPGTSCASGDFHWETLTPYASGGNWIYTVFLDGSEIFYKKVRGIRISARDDSVAEGPQIAHMELLSAMYLPAGDSPAVPVDLGWSKAFRAIIIDKP